MKAVILAGGKGTRLRPYTTVLPKPLMPIGERPILEILIRQMSAKGFKDIIVTTGYLAELIMTFLGDGSKFGVKIKYSKEAKPLGTAGGLGFIKDDLSGDFLMVNGDLLTTLNFADLVDYHRKNQAVATIALKKRQIHIDFGVIELEGSTNNIKGYAEKPTMESFVSMGVYVLNTDVLKYIKTDEYLDFPNLIQILMAAGQTVKGYVFDGYWLDIGRPDDYEKANTDIQDIHRMLGID
ncbi:MAG TPA: sugar phosphate nucleotidyltransferase [Dehalococcoidia bacterium]|nr:sugar phosphate nucleotidyltransferase [Dehalococcoidia bacterium]